MLENEELPDEADIELDDFMRERFAASAVTAVSAIVVDPVGVSAMLVPSDINNPGREGVLKGKKRLITESDREVGEVPMAYPSETSVLIAVLAAERSSLLRLDSEELAVCVVMDDDVGPVLIPLRCVSLLLEEDNRGGSDVLEILGTGASLDPGKTFAVDCSGPEVNEVPGVEMICGSDTWLELIATTVSRSGWENAADVDGCSPSLPDPTIEGGDA